jgi:hypothetical protein
VSIKIQVLWKSDKNNRLLPVQVTANKMQRFLNLFFFTDALHVSGGSSAHHQEHITVLTASVIVNNTAASCYRGRDGTLIQAVLPPIIMSTKLYIQLEVLSAILLLAATVEEMEL